jgi:hypothetical protein
MEIQSLNRKSYIQIFLLSNGNEFSFFEGLKINIKLIDQFK